MSIKMNNTLTLSLLILLLITASAAAYAGGGIQITIPEEEVRVESDTIKLKDLASIQCSDKELLQKLEDMYLSRTPGPGQHVRISRASIITRLNRMGIRNEQITLNMTDFVRVFSTLRRIDSKQLTETALQYLTAENLISDPAQARLVQHPSPIYYSGGELEYRCSIVPNSGQAIIVVNVEAVEGGASAGSARISFRVPRVSQTVSAEREEKPQKNTAPQGEVVVNRGDHMEIIIQKKNLTINVNGTALENGRTNQRIRVRVDSSGKAVRATVLGSKQALIEMP